MAAMAREKEISSGFKLIASFPNPNQENFFGMDAAAGAFGAPGELGTGFWRVVGFVLGLKPELEPEPEPEPEPLELEVLELEVLVLEVLELEVLVLEVLVLEVLVLEVLVLEVLVLEVLELKLVLE